MMFVLVLISNDFYLYLCVGFVVLLISSEEDLVECCGMDAIDCRCFVLNEGVLGFMSRMLVSSVNVLLSGKILTLTKFKGRFSRI